jgi:hypothetical protein
MTARAHHSGIVELRALSARLGRQAEDAAVRAGADIQDPEAGTLKALELIESDLAGAAQALRARLKVAPSEDLPEFISYEADPQTTLLEAEDRDRRAAAIHAALTHLSEPERRLLWLIAADPAPSYAEMSAALWDTGRLDRPHAVAGPQPLAA